MPVFSGVNWGSSITSDWMNNVLNYGSREQKTEYLFIGGTRDGHRLEIRDDMTRILLPSKPYQLHPSLVDSEEVDPVPLHETYLKMSLGDRNGENTQCLFVLEGMSPADVIKKLIDGYIGD